jgi:hypothetical protein
MSSSTLQEELLRVAGVAEAQVDATEGAGPAGVRVRLAPDADAESVGAEVQRVLAAHGMRSRLASAEPSAPAVAEHVEPTSAPAAVAPPAAPPSASPQFSETSSGDGSGVTAEPAVAPAPVATPEPFAPPAAAVPMEAPVEAPIAEPPAAPTASAETAPEPDEGPISTGRLSSLRVDETADGVTVTATTTDGRSITQRSDNTERGTFEAVVSAVGALADGAPPALLAMEHATVDGTEVFTVVVERRDGTRLAGAAVVRAARPYAVAAATWSALRS